MAKKATEKPSKNPASLEVERRIHFYRVECLDANGVFDPEEMASQVEAIPWDTGERNVQLATDADVCCWVLRQGKLPRLRVAYIRRSGLPEVAQGVQLTPLAIPKEAGLAESTYVQFFGGGIAGVLHNFYGPRMSQLAYYLRSRVGAVIPPIRFNPLLRHDALKRLKDLKHIKLFQLKIRRPFVETLIHQDPTLGKAFEAAFEAADGVEAEITIRSSRAEDDGLGKRIARVARRIVDFGDKDGLVKKLIVEGAKDTGSRRDAIDLLSDELLVIKTVQLQDRRSKAVTAGSAFAAIEGAYKDLKVILEAADSVEAIEA